MKNQLTKLLPFILCLFISSSVFGLPRNGTLENDEAISVSIDDFNKRAVSSKKMAKKAEKRKKKIAKIKKKFGKIQEKLKRKNIRAAIDFGHPVDKWLWYGVTAFVASLALWLIARILVFSVFSYLSYLAGLAAAIFFFIWLYNVFA